MKARFLTALAVGALAGPVTADSIGPAGFPFGDFFTPPLSASQSTSIPISYHITFAFSNWAGVRITTIIDTTEANFIGFTPAPAFNTTGAAGSTTVWSINATNTGQDVFDSVPIPLGSLALHAKGTTPLNNGDIDVVFQNVFNIYHVTPNMVSAPTTFFTATWLYLPPAVPVSLWGQGTPPQVGGGVWVHLTAAHTVHFAQSWFWGTSFFFNAGASGGIGIEHVPAPGAIALLACGVGMFGLARRRRR